ncbi:MAG: hypothetical protein IPJ34_19040 [Myxococcales bacterium]|nr:hypothetical protein [Myxococcales bacterium]
MQVPVFQVHVVLSQVSFCLPQFPQSVVRFSPIEHSAPEISSPQAPQEPHDPEDVQLRVCVPHMPHARLSVSGGVHFSGVSGVVSLLPVSVASEPVSGKASPVELSPPPLSLGMITSASSTVAHASIEAEHDRAKPKKAIRFMGLVLEGNQGR